MAAAKAAIRTSRDSLHKQELKRITDPVLEQQPNAPFSEAKKQANGYTLRSQETGKWLHPHQVTSMELTSRK